MIRSMMLGLAALALATAAVAEEEVIVVPQGQFYHRAGHLAVDVWKPAKLAAAVADGYSACPECTPPRLVNGKLRDPGPSAYFQTLVASTAAGTLFSAPITGRVPRTSEIEAASRAAAGGGGAQSFGPPGGAAAAAPAPAAAPVRTAAPAATQTAGPAAVPGTGGLLKPLTFSNSPFVSTSVNYTGQPVDPPK